MHMAAVCNPVSLSAAFMVGLAGSTHCLAMCGGISGALGMRARRVSAGGRTSGLALSHQIGRLTSYTVAGAIVGSCSKLILSVFDIDALAVMARLLAGSILLAIAANLLFKWNSIGLLERPGSRLWRRLAPLASRIPSQGAAGSLLLGMLWGWLPCGFVYSVLIFAALQGSALQGAAMMLFFGLGTLPALLGVGIVSSALGGVSRFTQVTGWALLVCGVLTILGPLNHLHH